MIVAHVLPFTQSLIAWLSSLTLAGIGAFVAWLWSLRKINAEIKKIKEETAAIKAQTASLVRSENIKKAVTILFRSAGIVRRDSNVAILSRADWAAQLPDPTLVDDALLEIGAQRVPGKDDDWEVPLSTISQQEPDRWK
jgi:hypothetical protein